MNFSMPATVAIRRARPEDIAGISELHAHVFGPGRFARSAYRVREGKGHLSRFCLVAEIGSELLASLRMTEITIGGTKGAALLGPIVVEPERRGMGLGTKLVSEGIEAARAAGTALVVLVGDMPYYGRFGFSSVKPGQITMPGPVDPARLLALELVPGALATAIGQVKGYPR